MRVRPFAPFAMMGLMIGLACAEPTPPQAAKAAPADEKSAKALLKQAMEAADNNDMTKGIALAEKAVAASPSDRESLFILGAMTQLHADSVKDKAGRIALFRRSSEVLHKLADVYKDLKPQEQMFLARSTYGEARAAALEGKPKEAVALIKKLVDDGLDDADMIDGESDFESIRGLPEYAELKAGLLKAMKESVAKELAESKSYPFDFSLLDMDDKPVKLADYKGKVTIVDVWGTWCPPCRKEIPHFVELYKDLHDKGLEIVGINCNEGDDKAEAKKTVKAFIAEQKIPYKCVLNDEKTESKIPDFQGYPTTLFLDRTGKVRLTLVGYTAKPKLDAIIGALMAEPAAN
ncbi:TlpA family protein disulfide reductase [Tundrisphaera sp. TA3]|uniref:TlpA family protein disulfide reductase n=1 Tax=Tundrisphaera sp. TA3 TaxID=3435775 RepID=UPI003EBACE88